MCSKRPKNVLCGNSDIAMFHCIQVKLAMKQFVIVIEKKQNVNVKVYDKIKQVTVIVIIVYRVFQFNFLVEQTGKNI